MTTLGQDVNYYTEENGKIILSTEKVFEPSYGTEPILIRIEKLLRDGDRTHTILINIATIIRNSLDKDLTIVDNIRRVENEISLIGGRIKFLYDNFGSNKHPYLVFFMTDYRKDYPEEKLRPITPGKKLYFDICKIFLKELDERTFKDENLTIHMLKLPSKDYGLELQKILRNVSTKVPTNNYTGDYYLISHYPLDYYVLNKCPSGKLINSHTGEILDRKLLGYKVFQEFNLPFNQLLHGVLGDKIQILPTVKIGSRIKIKDLGEQNNWMIKTEAQIKKDLKSIGIYVLD